MTRLTPEQINFRRTARFIEYVAELEINDLQKQTLLDVYQLIKHGSKFINLHIRKDGREYHFEADWLKQLFHSLSHTESDGWQTMETAPRDGTIILLSGGTLTCDDDTYETHYPANSVYVACWWKGAWQGERGESYGNYYWHHNPTHWRPLPAPPETKE